MNTYLGRIAHVAVCFTLVVVLGAVAVAAEEGEEVKKPVDKNIVVTGTISTMVDDDGAVGAIMITTDDDAAHFVVLDANGRKLGKEMDKKRVEVTGKLNEDEELVVEKYKAAPTKVEPAPEKVEPAPAEGEGA